MMKTAIALLTINLAVTACAPPPPPVIAPDWTELPPTVAEALCVRTRLEGISSETPLVVVKTTQPIVTASSMSSLSHRYSKEASGAAVQLADMIGSTLHPMPVALANASTCTFRAVDAVERGSDEMTLQLSSPFLNPFIRNEAGVLARLSLGGHDAQWYWVPLAQKKGQWVMSNVLPLDLHEQ